MPADAVEAVIRAFLADELRLDIGSLDRDSELVSTGIVDSMDLVRLATHLERRFDVSIPDAEIDVERFGTIARIVAYVETLKSG